MPENSSKMLKAKNVDFALVRRLFDYDPQAGVLTWRAREPFDGYSPKMVRRWNDQWAGKEAGYIHSTGYRLLNFNGKRYKAHRVAYLHYYGYIPTGMVVDHINGNPADDRICNLRLTTMAGNARNRKLGRNNTSGAIGVVWCKAVGKWKTSCRIMGQEHYLGLFDDVEAAKAVLTKFRALHGFTDRHGRAA